MQRLCTCLRVEFTLEGDEIVEAWWWKSLSTMPAVHPEAAYPFRKGSSFQCSSFLYVSLGIRHRLYTC